MGYDVKCVKLPKEVKRAAAQYLDPHKRGAVIRSFVKILESNRGQQSAKNQKGNK